MRPVQEQDIADESYLQMLKAMLHVQTIVVYEARLMKPC